MNEQRKKCLGFILSLCLLPAIAAGGCAKSETPPAGETAQSEILDLSGESAVIAYATLDAMVWAPEDYLGETVRITGRFTSVYDEALDKTFYAVLVSDTTQCCVQGLDFTPSAASQARVSALAEGDEITVQGVYGSYEEDGRQYYGLQNAQLL